MTIVGIVPNIREGKVSINEIYLNYVRKLGKLPTIVITDTDLKYVDEILLPGGVDISPYLFGYGNSGSANCDAKMDIFQINLVKQATFLDLNITGICRGLQLLAYMYLLPENKLMGYEQNISGHDQQEMNIPRSQPFHMVSSLEEKKTLWVNSMHHQALVTETYDKSPLITHTSKRGNIGVGKMVVEGVKFSVGKSQITAVQWHPEELE